MANVLKSTAAAPVREEANTAAARDISGLAGFNLDDFANQGRDRLQQCQSQIESMLTQAKKDAAVIKEQARKEGYEAGKLQAEVDVDSRVDKEADRQAKDGLKLIEQSVAAIREGYEHWMDAYAQRLNEISLAAAEKLTRRKLENEADILVSWAKEAVMSTRSANQLSVAVHPETLATLGEKLDNMVASPDLPEQTVVVPDATLKRSEVVVRQTGGEIQAGLLAQVERLRELLG